MGKKSPETPKQPQPEKPPKNTKDTSSRVDPVSGQVAQTWPKAHSKEVLKVPQFKRNPRRMPPPKGAAKQLVAFKWPTRAVRAAVKPGGRRQETG